MRRLRQIVWLLTASLLAQTAVAGDPPGNHNSHPGKLKAQLAALDARIQSLEEGVPTSDVNGRTYCSTLELTVMRGKLLDASEELQTNIVRRTATFSGGAFSGAYLSNVLNNQTDVGSIDHPAPTIIDPLLATYVQTGSKLSITFDQGKTATWYVSNDGSVVHGMKIEHLSFGGGAVTVGLVRNWTLIETDPNDICDMEGQ